MKRILLTGRREMEPASNESDPLYELLNRKGMVGRWPVWQWVVENGMVSGKR